MPIINPWFFYLANTVGNLKVFLAILLIISAAVLLWILGFAVFGDGLCFDYFFYDENEDDEAKLFRRFIKVLVLIIIINSLLLIFIPDKVTIYQMLASKYITTDVVNGGIEEIKGLVDYIFQKMSEVK